MRAMILEQISRPLRAVEIETPTARENQVLLRVEACGVCRTDLHIVDGDLTESVLPLIPGHEVVGRVEELGAGVRKFSHGEKVGVPWLGWPCGACVHCMQGRENLCESARFTGYTLNGGYAEYIAVDQRYCFPIGEKGTSAEQAPLLCAGLIGYRSLRFAEEASRLGLYGFGAAAHIVSQVARFQEREVYAFVREGDDAAAAFAMSLGAVWAGWSNETPPVPLDAAIIYAPVGELVPLALKAVRPGGTVICAGIHMSDIPSFPYELLWRERRIVSVANLERRDGAEFLPLAARIPVETAVQVYPLEDANRAPGDLRNGRLKGAAVLVP